MSQSRSDRVRISHWDRSSRFLIFGELLAFLAAVLAFVFDFPDDNLGKWCIYVTAAVASGTLAAYAIARSYEGDKPLTGIEARRIARIAEATAAEAAGGLAIAWHTLAPDGRTVQASLQGIETGAKRAMLRSQLGDVPVDAMSDEQVEAFFALIPPATLHLDSG